MNWVGKLSSFLTKWTIILIWIVLLGEWVSECILTPKRWHDYLMGRSVVRHTLSWINWWQNKYIQSTGPFKWKIKCTHRWMELKLGGDLSVAARLHCLNICLRNVVSTIKFTYARYKKILVRQIPTQTTTTLAHCTNSITKSHIEKILAIEKWFCTWNLHQDLRQYRRSLLSQAILSSRAIGIL